MRCGSGGLARDPEAQPDVKSLRKIRIRHHARKMIRSTHEDMMMLIERRGSKKANIHC